MLRRARFVKEADPDPSATIRVLERPVIRLPDPKIVAFARARRIAHEILEAREEAARIVEAAQAKRDEIAARATEDARAEETARFAATFLGLRAEDETRAERDLDRAVELAVVLAERLVGETLGIAPARIAELAAAALAQTRGAREIRIDACPDDVEALRSMLAEVGRNVDVRPEPSLGRGSLVVHTDIGRIDGRIEVQLDRLSVALREALRETKP